MKKISLLFLTALLAACSSAPNFNGTHKPLLNMEAAAAERAEVSLAQDQATVTNRTNLPLSLAYAVFWYDKIGVTSDGQDQPRWQLLNLQPQQTQQLPIVRPNPESENYRFYLRLK